MKPPDLESVIDAAGDRPWFFWCNPGDTHAPWWKLVQQKLVDPEDKNSAPKDIDPAAITMLPWMADTPKSRVDVPQYYSCVKTFLESFGLTNKDPCHGSSLWTVLAGQARTVEGRKTILIETNNGCMSQPGNKGDRTMARAVCDGRYYYIANLGDAPAEELCDLETDPWAVKNLANDSTSASKLHELRVELKSWRELTQDRDIHPRDIPRRVK